MLALLMVPVLFSCRKSDRDYDNSVKACTDQVVADQLMFDLFIIVDEAAKNEFGTIPGYTAGKLNCATVSSNLVSTPKTINIDFGSGCTGADGITRSGNLILSLNGNYSDSGTVVTINPSNFSLNGYQIQSDLSLVNYGTVDGNQWMQLNNIDILIKDDLDQTITYTSVRDYLQIAGSGTFQVNDDGYSTEGNSSGRSRSGNTFSASITSDLVFDVACPYIISGQMDVQPANIATRYLDLGNGCDSVSIATINETSHYVFH